MPASAGIRYVRAPMIAPSRRLPLVLLVMAACGANAASVQTAANSADAANDAYRVLAGNWAFAGWQSCWQQLRETAGLEVVGDEAAWQQFANERAAKHDEAALALVRELVPPDRAEAIARFEASWAGRSLARAEGMAQALAWNIFDVPTETLATFRSPTQVGEAAGFWFHHYGYRMKAPELALTLASGCIWAEQAEAIDAFHRTEDGAVWLAVRDEARKRTRDRVVAVQGEAMDRGLVKNHFAGLTLPKAEFAEPESPR